MADFVILIRFWNLEIHTRCPKKWNKIGLHCIIDTCHLHPMALILQCLTSYRELTFLLFNLLKHLVQICCMCIWHSHFLMTAHNVTHRQVEWAHMTCISQIGIWSCIVHVCPLFVHLHLEMISIMNTYLFLIYKKKMPHLFLQRYNKEGTRHLQTFK